MVGEIATQRMLVVINKTDLLPAGLRAKLVAKARHRLGQTLAATKFAGCPMVAVSAKPGGSRLLLAGAGTPPLNPGISSARLFYCRRARVPRKAYMEFYQLRIMLPVPVDW